MPNDSESGCARNESRCACVDERMLQVLGLRCSDVDGAAVELIVAEEN